MRAFPFGIPPLVGTVTSASSALSASFISANINTSSIALNQLGPVGPSGSNLIVSGSQGAQGPSGPQGPKGLGVYLLSSSLATCYP